MGKRELNAQLKVLGTTASLAFAGVTGGLIGMCRAMADAESLVESDAESFSAWVSQYLPELSDVPMHVRCGRVATVLADAGLPLTEEQAGVTVKAVSLVTLGKAHKLISKPDELVKAWRKAKGRKPWPTTADLEAVLADAGVTGAAGPLANSEGAAAVATANSQRRRSTNRRRATPDAPAVPAGHDPETAVPAVTQLMAKRIGGFSTAASKLNAAKLILWTAELCRDHGALNVVTVAQAQVTAAESAPADAAPAPKSEAVAPAAPKTKRTPRKRTAK